MSSKKDRLKGAIKSELKGDGIMREFIKNVNDDKKNDDKKNEPDAPRMSETRETPAAGKEDKKAVRQKARLEKTSSRLPVPRNNTPKEWWVSFFAFLFVVVLILGAYYISTYERIPSSFVRLSGGPLSEEKTYPHSEHPRFRIGEPVFITYFSDGPVNTDLIAIHVFVLNPGNTRSLITSSQYRIDRRWHKIETHFQKEFFEYPGTYEIVIENENKGELAKQVFEVTR